MIHVKRGVTPKSLDGAQSPGGLETAKAIRLRGKRVKYRAYKRPDVVEALRAMFNRKCAYCEFNYAPGGPEDVEHFRPKGGVLINGRVVKPGYYWLAAEWANLLPSCIDCNRYRGQRFANGKRGKSGKANCFPVADEQSRWTDHDAPCSEVPTLLNPCDDDPAAHLEFIRGGLLQARLGDGAPSIKGQASIEVFGLLRRDLVDARRAKETWVRAHLESALEAAELAAQESNATRRLRLEKHAETLLEQARLHASTTEPFLAVTRAVFREFGIELPAPTTA